MLSAYITHPTSLLHEMGPDHPEGPARVSAVNDYLLAQGLLDFMVPYTAPAATRGQIERVHTSLHIAEFESSAPVSGYFRIDPDTLLNPHTVEAARHAAGAAVLATELVARGEVATAFCNVRPAGHHATRSEGMGFCFFNNVAVGIAHALAECGMERVALVDFDAHHGNGSEDIFAGDERVLMVSTFERGLYPYNGEEPTGPNLCNVPLERYSRGDALRDAVTNHWLPALDAFRPQMIFFSAGFDAHRDDDMSRLMWVDEDYAWLTREVMTATARHARGRIVSLLEGGYSLPALARSAAAHVRVLIGAD
jgi:acetoin utilization deacetylase AcuC-like enzyme